MIMTEWGFHAIPSYPTETVTNYGKPITDWMESLGISWTTWCASDDWAPAMFSSSWGLLIGDCCEGGFTKDLLYTKRNSDQPSASSAVARTRTPAGREASADLIINGRRFPVALTDNQATLKLVSLQGRALKEYGICASKSITEKERINPGVYLLLSISGKGMKQNKIVTR